MIYRPELWKSEKSQSGQAASEFVILAGGLLICMILFSQVWKYKTNDPDCVMGPESNNHCLTFQEQITGELAKNIKQISIMMNVPSYPTPDYNITFSSDSASDHSLTSSLDSALDSTLDSILPSTFGSPLESISPSTLDSPLDSISPSTLDSPLDSPSDSISPSDSNAPLDSTAPSGWH